MAVVEPGAEGIVALEVPAFDEYSRKLPGAVATVLVAENIAFANVLGAGGMFAKEFAGEIGFTAVFPYDAQVGADKLEGFRRTHSGKARYSGWHFFGVESGGL